MVNLYYIYYMVIYYHMMSSIREVAATLFDMLFITINIF